jgi:DNA topoisomerase-1
MKIVVVESPAKAKTINKYLGPGYEVLASFGHVRDLPAKDGSVDPEQDFRMLWEVDDKSAKRLNDISRAVKDADGLILATDPDREGEAISWHVLEVLKEKKALKKQTIERVVFNAITKQSVMEAMKNPRQIDGALVDAYLARRALDYLVGFTLSPVLWRKLPGARSAGRVQSVALRLVSDRELEIEKFVAREYWSLVAQLATPRNEAFEARLVGADGQKIQRLDIGSGQEAEDFKKALETAAFTVNSVEAKPGRRNPYPPFMTSTLQQEASRKYGFAPAHTMRLAQRLYEGADIDGETVGLITYMRTDGVDIAPEAISSARRLIESDYGKQYVPSSPRQYVSKSKNAQEAHEAIRPTDLARRPAAVRRMLEPDQARLYELIWLRTVASQMESAELERTTVDITAKVGSRVLDLRATGTVIKFDGFLTLYTEDTDDKSDEEDANRLPAMSAGEALTKREIQATQHFTEPPPRYSEASLVKRMEELGIGRPSTYASILQVLRDRGYVRLDKKRLVPEDKGRVLTAFLENFFQKYVEYDFTAGLEEQLDKISNNELPYKDVLRAFWEDFTAAVGGIKDLRIAQVIDALDEMLSPHLFPPKPDGSDPRKCPNCENGRIGLKLGRFGGFVGCSNYPECKFTRQLSVGPDGQGGGMRKLGDDPDTGLEVTVRSGRFGSYLQLGEATKDEDGKAVKPKRASLPKGVAPDEIDLDRAVKLLALPRTIGKHPDDGEDIIAGVGRFGPYVKHGKIYANITADEDILNVGLNRAVALIEEKKANPGKGRRGAEPGKQLGEHPQKGGMIVAKNGRYGPYVSHDGVNANLTGDKTPETITLDEAAALIDDRAARSGGRSTARRKRPARGASAAKKAPAPKARPAAQANRAAAQAHKPAARANKAPAAEAKPKKRAAASAAKTPRKSKKAKAEAAE